MNATCVRLCSLGLASWVLLLKCPRAAQRLPEPCVVFRRLDCTGGGAAQQPAAASPLLSTTEAVPFGWGKIPGMRPRKRDFFKKGRSVRAPPCCRPANLSDGRCSGVFSPRHAAAKREAAASAGLVVCPVGGWQTTKRGQAQPCAMFRHIQLPPRTYARAHPHRRMCCCPQTDSVCSRATTTRHCYCRPGVHKGACAQQQKVTPPATALLPAAASVPLPSDVPKPCLPLIPSTVSGSLAT